MSIFERARELAVVSSAASVVGWDQETHLPPGGARHRASQLAWLSSRAHEMATSEDWKRDLESAEDADSGDDAKTTANLREIRRNFDRATKLPVELISREASASSLAKHAWADGQLARSGVPALPNRRTNWRESQKQ